MEPKKCCCSLDVGEFSGAEDVDALEARLVVLL
jgi:hypothetical protein